MRLTTYTDYAFRVLMQVTLADGELVRIADIAKTFGISHNHLTKVVHNLGTLGYLKTVQGRNGGMYLAKPANEITVGQIVRAFEPDFQMVQCFSSDVDTCRIDPACALKNVLHEETAHFLDRLDKVTLADLVHPREHLTLLLTTPEGRPSGAQKAGRDQMPQTTRG